MGDRGHIVVHGHVDTSIVLYSHWHATHLPTILANALAKEARWGDPEYLTRIIADQVSANASDTTGTGIGTSIHGDAWRIIDVYPMVSAGKEDIPDEKKKTVAFRDDVGYSDDNLGGREFTFEEFIEKFVTVEEVTH